MTVHILLQCRNGSTQLRVLCASKQSFHDLYFSPNIIRLIRSIRMCRVVGHVASIVVEKLLASKEICSMELIKATQLPVAITSYIYFNSQYCHDPTLEFHGQPPDGR